MRPGFLLIESSTACVTLPDWHALLAAFAVSAVSYPATT